MKKSFSEFTTVYLMLTSLMWLILLLTLLLDVIHSKSQKSMYQNPQNDASICCCCAKN